MQRKKSFSQQARIEHHNHFSSLGSVLNPNSRSTISHQFLNRQTSVKNLWDHISPIQQWKLTPKYAELTSSTGSPLWTDPKFETGNAMDHYTTFSVPSIGLKAALHHDGVEGMVAKALADKDRCHLAVITQYSGLPLDGTSITTFLPSLIPTSKGTVSLKSAVAKDSPVINPHHFETEADRYRLRMGMRKVIELMNSEACKEIIAGEVVPEAMGPVTDNSSDEEIDERIRTASQTIQHPAGTVSMGQVIDTAFRPKGVDGLRVVDASVIPTPITCPIQALVYALGELAVDVILGN